MEDIINKAADIAAAVGLILTGLTVIFMLIPGEQPEKTFRKISEILSKFSRKSPKL